MGRWTSDRYGFDWRRFRVLKMVPHINDTVLLLAGIGMLHLMGIVPDWVWVKLAFLPVYVVLASTSLSPHRKAWVQVLSGLAAMVTVGFMISVAINHDPIGVFRLLKPR